MEYKKININDLKEYEKNSRTHSNKQILQIKESIKQFGFTNPLLVKPDLTIIAGHGRLEAIKALNKLDYKDNPISEIPCIIVSGLSENDYKALVIADNKIALNAGWDLDILKEELTLLENENYNLDLIGFNNDELNDLFNISVDDVENNNLNISNQGQEVKEKFKLLIELDNEEELENLYNGLLDKGYKCRVLSL